MITRVGYPYCESHLKIPESSAGSESIVAHRQFSVQHRHESDRQNSQMSCLIYLAGVGRFMTDGGTTIGVWVGEDDDVIDEFDERLDCGPNHVGSRSEEIKEAMRLAVVVQETIDGFPYEIDGAPLRHQVRQALIEQDRREAAMED